MYLNINDNKLIILFDENDDTFIVLFKNKINETICNVLSIVNVVQEKYVDHYFCNDYFLHRTYWADGDFDTILQVQRLIEMLEFNVEVLITREGNEWQRVLEVWGAKLC